MTREKAYLSFRIPAERYDRYVCIDTIYLSIMACLKPLKIPNIHPSGNPVRTQSNAVRIDC